MPADIGLRPPCFSGASSTAWLMAWGEYQSRVRHVTIHLYASSDADCATVSHLTCLGESRSRPLWVTCVLPACLWQAKRVGTRNEHNTREATQLLQSKWLATMSYLLFELYFCTSYYKTIRGRGVGGGWGGSCKLDVASSYLSWKQYEEKTDRVLCEE